MKTRKRNKRRTKRGGQKVHKYNISMVPNQVCVHENDCGPEVFHAMGYMSLENARYLATLRPFGLRVSDVTMMLREAYGDVEVRDLTTHTQLKNNEAVVADYRYKDGLVVKSHYFIVYKKPEGDELYVFDPYIKHIDDPRYERHNSQVVKNREGTLRLGEYIKPHRRLPGIEGFKLTYIHSDEVTQHKEKVSREIIESVFNPLPDMDEFDIDALFLSPPKRYKIHKES
jgi:hypothetical protein